MVETWIALALVVVGVVGIVVPVLPGLSLIVVGIGVWAFGQAGALGWTVFGIAVAIVVLGSVLKYLLPGQRLRDSGVPGRTIALGAVLGIVGFFVIPVLGLFIGFVLGIYLAELARLGDSARAWPSTREALVAVGWSVLIELATGMLAVGAWVVGLLISI